MVMESHVLKFAILQSILILCPASQGLRAQTPDSPTKPVVPDWALPGSATHTQVAPPADFHRPTKTFDAPIGMFEGQSGQRQLRRRLQAVHRNVRGLQHLVLA
jgi:hypothetical protein